MTWWCPVGVGAYFHDRWRMWGNLLFWLPPLHQGFGLIPKHQTEERGYASPSPGISECAQCSRLSILLETPPSNCQLQLLLSSRCFLWAWKSTQIPGITGVKWAPSRLLRLSSLYGSTLSHTPKIKAGFLSVLVRDHELISNQLCKVKEELRGGVPTCLPCSSLLTFDLHRNLVQGHYWEAESSKLQRLATVAQIHPNFPTETLKIRQSLSFWFCWMRGAIPQEPQTSTNSYLNRCQTCPRLRAPLDK